MANKNGLQKTQEAVEEVTEIMMDNYFKSQEREEKLSDLDERAEELRERGKVFEKTTRTLMEQKKEEYDRHRCISKRARVIAVIVLVLVLVILGICIAFAIRYKGQGDQEATRHKENNTTLAAV